VAQASFVYDVLVAIERRTVNFTGTVQGVGFRYTAMRIARRYDVTGYVSNLPDGSVECVVEGEASHVIGFLGDLRSAMGEYIQDETQETSAATGEFGTFGVR
jgi:acylphosphatase